MQTIAPIMDNGPTHAPKQLEKWLSEQAAEQGWGVTFQLPAEECLVAGSD